MKPEQKKQAKITSLRLLAATPKSRRELSKKLLDKGFDGEVVEETLNELEAQGILNDRAYAQNLVSRFTHAKPSGMRKISFELKRHGVSSQLQEEMIANAAPEEEIQRARELAEGRWEKWKSLPGIKRKKRVFDFLIRRGFNFQLAKDILDELGPHEPEN